MTKYQLSEWPKWQIADNIKFMHKEVKSKNKNKQVETKKEKQINQEFRIYLRNGIFQPLNEFYTRVQN